MIGCLESDELAGHIKLRQCKEGVGDKALRLPKIARVCHLNQPKRLAFKINLPPFI